MSDVANRLILSALADTDALTADNCRLRREVENLRKHNESLTRDLCRLRVIVAGQQAEIRRLKNTQETT